MGSGVTDWYHDIVDSGRAAAICALIGFVVTFALVRFVTARIRARAESAGTAADPQADPQAAPGHDHRRMLGDISIGGVHVHHQVWGILLVLVAGLFQFRFQPSSPGVEILATMFGIGAALALDEFALWFYLDDVYWSDEGRKSITAVLVGAAVGGALLLSSSPFGLDFDDPDPELRQTFWSATVVVLVNMACAFVCVLKGKLATGVIGVVIPVVALVGAVRLAKPTSWWARRRYAARKLERARKRFGPRWEARHDRIQDFLSGASRSGGLEPDPRPGGSDVPTGTKPSPTTGGSAPGPGEGAPRP
jgi:hypothetical protein